jgi:hypothetical protein
MDGAKAGRRFDVKDMAPNTRKQQSLRRIEKAVGATMPTDVYNHMSLLPVRDIDALAEWLEGVASGRTRDSVLPLDDFDA